MMTGEDAVAGELTLDSSWPGLDAPAGQIEVDVDVLLELADRLDREADYLEGGGSGTPTQLATDTNVPCGSFGTWQTAYQMEAGHTESRRHVVSFFGQLVLVMRRTAELARGTAEAHQQAEQAIQANMDGRQTALGDQPAQAA